MKTFDKLYKRTKTGAIQQWSVDVSYNEPDANDPHDAVITKKSGQLNGQLTIHSEPVLVGKQKRSAFEQAVFQAESDWKSKKDSGYKTRQELGIDISGDLMHYSFKSTNYKTLTESLEAALPKFNSGAEGVTLPMLATDWTKIKKIEYPCFCEPKLDGVRALMIVDVDQISNMVGQAVKFLSRSGKEYNSLGHIEMDVIEYLVNAKECPNNFILDGEIYSEELNFQEIVSAVKAQKPNSLKLKFRAYDIVSEENQWNRRISLIKLTDAINSDLIERIEWTTVSSEQEARDYHDLYVSQGYEGAILRSYKGVYAQGQRSRELLKVKEFDSNEFAFKNFEFGQRGVEDLIAVCWTDTDLEFRAKMIGTREQKEELYKQNDLEGRSLTVKHFGWTDSGDRLPRFPIGMAFRTYE